MKNWHWLLMIAVVGLGVEACGTPSKKRKNNNDDDNGSSVGGGASVGGGSSTGGAGGTSTVQTTTVMTMCGNLPTFNECLDCFCNQDSVGCEAFLSAYIGNFYCGLSCAETCTVFCADPSTTASQACEDCLNVFGEDPLPPNAEIDVSNYQSDCGASSTCVGFINTLSACP